MTCVFLGHDCTGFSNYLPGNVCYQGYDILYELEREASKGVILHASLLCEGQLCPASTLSS